METRGLSYLNVESVVNVIGKCAQKVIGNADDDGNQVKFGNRDQDEGKNDDACNLVNMEQSIDNDNFKLVNARKNLKEFSIKYKLKTRFNIEATSQLDLYSSIELEADLLMVDASR